MALNVPGFQLEPSAEKIATASNYITDFNFMNQYLPDTYEKEFERYGNRTISSFLRMVGAEMPTNSDLIKWAEQGRLHTKYEGCTFGALAVGQQTFTVLGGVACNFRVGQTVMLSSEQAPNESAKALIVTAALGASAFTVAYYDTFVASPFTAATLGVTAFVYGSEFQQGTQGMEDSLEAQDEFFDNKPIIIKDKYIVSGSDMAQIGWVEITTENGANGYLWYLKSEHETRLRYDDYLEMSMIEGIS